MARVSVIIPAYNAESYIDEAVASALRQTHADTEIIVVDDGSTDSTPAKLARYGDRITVITQVNRGLPGARNAGAERARGEWLAFLDADDVWLPEKLARQLEAMNGETVMSYTDRFNIGAKGSLPDVQSQVTPMYRGDLFLPLLLYGNFITASSTMILRGVFNDLGGFFAPLRACEDWDLWLRLATTHHISFCGQPLVKYRFHAGGMSRDYRKMWAERSRVIARALDSERGRHLGPVNYRRIWAQTWITNASEAGQAHRHWEATKAYARAVRYWPFDERPYKEGLKLYLGR